MATLFALTISLTLLGDTSSIQTRWYPLRDAEGHIQLAFDLDIEIESP